MDGSCGNVSVDRSQSSFKQEKKRALIWWGLHGVGVGEGREVEGEGVAVGGGEGSG